MSLKHPFTKGQLIKAVNATEPGIPIKEGKTYTVKRTFIGDPHGAPSTEIPGMERTPGVELKEMPGNYFRADRFVGADP